LISSDNKTKKVPKMDNRYHRATILMKIGAWRSVFQGKCHFFTQKNVKLTF